MTAAAILAFVLKHLKLVAYGAAVAAVILLFAAYRAERDGRRKAEAERDQARSAAIVQKGQADLNTKAATVADSAASRAVTITVRSEGAAHAIEAAPGASEALPDAVRRATLDAIGELRREAAAAAQSGDPGGGAPAPAVPAS